MAKLRIKLNRKGVRELLQSDDIRNVCAERARAAIAHLCDGYETNTYTGRTRVYAGIKATTRQARRDAL